MYVHSFVHSITYIHVEMTDEQLYTYLELQCIFGIA